jgi:hypothetical protein
MKLMACGVIFSDGQITFAFAIFIVNNDHHLPRAYP